MNKEQSKILKSLKHRPVILANTLGFDKLKGIHNDWIIDMVYGVGDKTLQAHRGSYKTTCVSVALLLLTILYPNQKALFIRKTDNDVKEIISQVQKMLKSDVVRYIVSRLWGVELILTRANSYEINTNLVGLDPKGTSQVNGMGVKGSLTGKHYDKIFTDDIVNLTDRKSRAEREDTKTAYQELQNLKNRGGRIYNTGTPWHKEDCFSLMPEAEKYDCYSTGIMTEADIREMRDRMLPSLFSANYELRHIAGEDVIFFNPQRGAEPEKALHGLAHVDSAFYGEDYTAFTVMQKHDGKYYVFGKIWRKHVEDCYMDIMNLYNRFLCSKLYNETNADKGMVAKELRKQGMKVVTYHESLNKHIKIVTYLKAIWKDVIFIEGTDESYINQICDYTEDAEHDDAPDSCACLARLMYKKSSNNNQSYQSLFGG